MRLSALFVALFFTVSLTASLLSVAVVAPTSYVLEARQSPGEREFATSDPEEFRLDPDAGEWVAFAPQYIQIEVENASFELRPTVSVMVVDDISFNVSWHAASGSIRSANLPKLGDGLHVVEAALVPVEGEVVDLAWTFGVDTQVPHLEMQPLPDVTQERSLVIQGVVTEPQLVGVRVQGAEVPVDGGAFSFEVSLWPGLNDLAVEAEDLAGNLGRWHHVAELALDPHTESLRTWVYENGSFTIDLPESWLVRQNVVLGSGSRGDIVAFGPLTPGLQTSLIVTSRRTILAFPRTTALEWMDLLLTRVEAEGQLARVVSESRILDAFGGTTAVQATYLERFTAQLVAFNQVTMVWSHTLQRQWILVASIDARNSYDGWAVVDSSMSSFRVIGGAPPSPFEEEQESRLVVGTMIVVVAAVALVSVLSAVVLERPFRRWRERRAQRWKPPRNWKM
jgi:hypothetical protein